MALGLRAEIILMLALPLLQTDSAAGRSFLGYGQRHGTESARQAHPETEVTQDFKWLVLENIPRFTHLSAANSSQRQWEPCFS